MKRFQSWLEKKKIKRKERILSSLKGETFKQTKQTRQIGKINSKKTTIKLCKPKKEKTPDKSIKYNEEIRKKSILIGLNYPGSHYSLNGCVNDVKNGAEFLKEKNYDVKMLVDEDISKSYNVIQALTELGNSAQQIVFFHYSGHGTQSKDLDQDEVDALDEVVYSKDDVLVTDDDINRILLTYPANKTVILVFDCCHSGSIADLPYILNVDGKIKEEKVKKTVLAKVICISGCKDDQTSADMTERGISFGALSSTMYSLLRHYDGKDVTWRMFYQDLVSEMKKKRYAQYPILSTSHASFFDEKVSL